MVRAAGTAPASVIIVNYETSDFVKRCVESLRDEKMIHEIIVVDNPSPAQDWSNLQTLDVKLVRLAENVGYGRGCNAGAEGASGELITILNPDTYVTPGAFDIWTSVCLEEAKRRKLGVLGPRLLNENGTVQRSTYGFLTPLNYWLYHSLLAGGLKKLRKSLRMESAQGGGEIQPVDWVMGAALMIPRDAWEAVGGFGENYFLYGEDADLCIRLHDAGYGVYYAPGASIYHTQGEPSAERRGAQAVRLFTGIRTFIYQHFGVFRRASIEACVILDMIMRLVIFAPLALVQRKNVMHRSRLKGYWAVFRMYVTGQQEG